MQPIILVILIAIAGGLAAGFQAPFAGLMNQRIGTLGSMFLTYAGGGVVITVLFLTIGGGNLGVWRRVPWYTLAAGLLGLMIIGSLSYAIPRLGVATTITLFIATQLILSALLDHFGLLGAAVRPIDLPRLIGMVILFLGTWLVARP